jgi:hypothetical protein
MNLRIISHHPKACAIVPFIGLHKVPQGTNGGTKGTRLKGREGSIDKEEVPWGHRWTGTVICRGNVFHTTITELRMGEEVFPCLSDGINGTIVISVDIIGESTEVTAPPVSP